MDLTKYFDNLPEELECTGAVGDYKLLALYAYNAYFNADSLKTDELLDSLTFSRDHKYNIDGVFINENVDEDTLEVVLSYFVGEGMFSQTEVMNMINYASSHLGDIIDRKSVPNINKKAEDLILELFTEIENKKIIIRVITDYNPDSSENYNITKVVEASTFLTKKFKLSATISFGQDVVNLVESNKEPFDNVREGKLIIDDPNNTLKYQDNSFICNISALSLKALWDAEGSRGLLADNLRYYVKSENIDDKIENSILFDYKNFWYLNNGIIIVCDDYNIVGNELRMSKFSIVNGGQTTRMIGKIPFDKDFFVSCKVVKNNFPTSKEKNIFVSKVAEASNSQKPIKAKDIIANRVEQRDLKSNLKAAKIFIEIKRGEKADKMTYKEHWQKTKNNELAQDLYAFVFMEPGPARNNVSKILQSEEKYNTLFVEHTYSADFIKSVLFVEKAYRQYKKKFEKNPEIDPTKRGLIKNGLFYTMAIIGYMLKLVYNKEYRNTIEKYNSNDAYYNAYSVEPAFDHGFIPDGMEYKDFVKLSEQIFDYVFDTLLVPAYEMAKASNPSIAYSNWTKTNSAFNSIRKSINFATFNQTNYTNFVDTFRHWFRPIDEEQENANIDRFVDYCKACKFGKAKDLSGNELSENDEALRNALMIFRLNRANEKHIQERMIFTDKMLEKLVIRKPATMDELRKIVSPSTAYQCGEEILKIIQDNF